MILSYASECSLLEEDNAKMLTLECLAEMSSPCSSGSLRLSKNLCLIIRDVGEMLLQELDKSESSNCDGMRRGDVRGSNAVHVDICDCPSCEYSWLASYPREIDPFGDGDTSPLKSSIATSTDLERDQMTEEEKRTRIHTVAKSQLARPTPRPSLR